MLMGVMSCMLRVYFSFYDTSVVYSWCMQLKAWIGVKCTSCGETHHQKIRSRQNLWYQVNWLCVMARMMSRYALNYFFIHLFFICIATRCYVLYLVGADPSTDQWITEKQNNVWWWWKDDLWWTFTSVLQFNHTNLCIFGITSIYTVTSSLYGGGFDHPFVSHAVVFSVDQHVV